MSNQTAAALAKAPDGASTALLWPRDVPGDADAEEILCAACAGLTAAGDAALDATLAALTPLEREALAGAVPGIDPGPLRVAAALRYRIASAIGTAPAPGAEFDLEAGRALLTRVDEVLAAVSALAIPERAGEVDAVRHALVKDAVDFSELLGRLSMPTPAPERAPEPRVHAPAPVARVVVRQSSDEPRSSRRVWIAFALVAVLAAAYHGHRILTRPPPPARPSVAGAPDGAFGYASRNGSRLVISGTGAPLSPAEVEAFRQREEAAGRTVREVAPGVWVSAPAGEEKGSP